MQWHPILASLLRSLLQDYYEVRTEMPVGDLPRQADIVLLRRTAVAPFVGLWSHLTAWNVLEFKGPSDSPALRDLDLLVEIGFGIDRRLNEERQEREEPPLDRGETSWWYLANHLGHRFLAEAERLMGAAPVPTSDGLWRCQLLGRPLWLVSRDFLPAEADCVPLRLVTFETEERNRDLARFIVRQPTSRQMFGSWLATLFPELQSEVQDMLREIGEEMTLNLLPAVEIVGVQRAIDQIGLERVITEVGAKKVIDLVGLQQVIELSGVEQVIKEIGPEVFWEHLTPEQRDELKRRPS